MMTLATTPGSVIMDRWGALISVMLAPAFWAMASCSAGGRTLSAVATMSQEGVGFRAGAPDGSASPLDRRGRWVAGSAGPSAGGAAVAERTRHTLGSEDSGKRTPRNA